MTGMLCADKIVSISRFNKGEANRIFKEVKDFGTKIVFKNNMPECVLISPEQYEELMESIIDYELYIQAMERLNDTNSKIYSSEEVERMLGLSE